MHSLLKLVDACCQTQLALWLARGQAEGKKVGSLGFCRAVKPYYYTKFADAKVDPPGFPPDSLGILIKNDKD